MIMPHSNNGLAKKPILASGKKVINMGTTAQCIAHKVEAVIPKRSSFDVCFVILIAQIYIKCNNVAFYFVYLKLA